MKLHSALVICLTCLLTFSMASPGRNARIRKERKEQRLQEAEQEPQLNSDNLRSAEYKVDVTPLRGKANQAGITGVLARYDWNNNLQSYYMVVAEARNDDHVRLSACRLATRKPVSEKELYTPKFGCRDITNMKFPRFNSLYEAMLYITPIFEENKNTHELDMSRMKINYNLSFKMFRSSFRDLSVQFRFDKNKRYKDASDAITMAWDEWECPESNENYDDCIWLPARQDTPKRAITPYEWRESLG